MLRFPDYWTVSSTFLKNNIACIYIKNVSIDGRWQTESGVCCMSQYDTEELHDDSVHNNVQVIGILLHRGIISSTWYVVCKDREMERGGASRWCKSDESDR